MEILSYVAELIQSRKEIDIFGLGTIYKKKSPGRYDTATHTFLPPSYQIAFRQDQSENDALPIYISDQRNISKESADYFISVFVKEIHEQLASQGNADFSPLGTLIATEELIRFEPNQDFKAGFEFFGLPAVKNVVPVSPQQETLMPLHDPIETVENITEEEVFDFNGTEEEPEEIIIPEDVIEEVQDSEVVIEAEPAPIQQLEQIETPESDAFLEEDEPEKYNSEDKEDVVETIPEPLDHEADNDIQEKHIKQDHDGEENQDGVLSHDNEIQEIPTNEAAKPELDEQIQLENIIEEENPGQESQEEIYTTPASASFYASNNPAATENTVQYTIPEKQNGGSNSTYVKVLIWVTAVLILALLVYLLIPMLPESFKKPAITVASNKKDTVVIARPQLIDTTKLQDSVETSVAIAASEKKENPVANPQPIKEITPVRAKADTVVLYEIIGASVANQKEADQFIRQMKKSGIAAKVVTNLPGKRLKMSIATFKDEKAARLERARLEKKLKIDGIYIYINKPE